MEFSIKDFDKLDIYSKSSIASIIVLFPFWYISLYLFNKPFYIQSDIFLKVLFSFCFSIIWFASNIGIMLIELQFLRIVQTMPIVFKYSGFRSVLYLSAYIVIAYTSLKLTYTKYLIGAYSWLILFNAISIGVDVLFKKRK
jgi:hypothetical protein